MYMEWPIWFSTIHTAQFSVDTDIICEIVTKFSSDIFIIFRNCHKFETNILWPRILMWSLLYMTPCLDWLESQEFFASITFNLAILKLHEGVYYM
uniref:Uncharacterized protein n=1 Tax=Rhizophora mucronata TaxID=61149 RepID=A0A2P2QSC2_RHIMU